MQDEYRVPPCLLERLGVWNWLAIDRKPMIERLQLVDRKACGCLADVCRHRSHFIGIEKVLALGQASKGSILFRSVPWGDKKRLERLVESCRGPWQEAAS